ncbi:MAG: carbon starvation protein A [Bacteroidaceae bacterium]|nr:carbon starvation protein A [Bacteroidaceae bacterium]
MISFLASIFLLIVGYFVYGKIVERIFGVDTDRQTPCYSKRDDVDFMPIATWRVYLIEFLNIAGTGPIFGAILGIMYGPAAYLWIVFGCIFAGAVHDYLVGMISIRKGGASVPEIVGGEMGRTMYRIMFLFSICLLLLVATVFTVTSADLLQTLTSGFSWSSHLLWIIVILLYFLLATIFPIGQIIGRLYPLFGACLLIMAIGVFCGTIFEPGYIPEITDGIYSHHPKCLPVFPMLCVTIACGAISGFHATQAPMMSRCITNESHGRKVFYGAMITEGIVAMIWAAAAIKFAGSYENLAAMGTPATVVHKICASWLGIVGSILAILGVIVAPVTSGDTAFRSSRLMIAEHYKLGQKSFHKRFYICIPLFALSCLLMCLDFSVLWRYFAWCNQTVACIMLWVGYIWLKKNGRNYWIALVPALFMTVLSISYIILAPEGFDLWNKLYTV